MPAVLDIIVVAEVSFFVVQQGAERFLGPAEVFEVCLGLNEESTDPSALVVGWRISLDFAFRVSLLGVPFSKINK